MAPAGGRSGSDVEQLGDEGGLGPHVASANPPYLPLPHHRHHLVACQCSSCRPEAAEAKPRSDQTFHAPMVLFPNVIEMLDLAQPGLPHVWGLERTGGNLRRCSLCGVA